MAQPPAEVVRTYKPKGRLQLHRLHKPGRFHCVNCRQDKTRNLVATIGGDWTQTVCRGCYDGMVHQQGAADRAKRHLAQAKQPPRKVKPTRQAGTPPPPGKRERELKGLFPGVDRVFAFFRAAGVRVEVARSGFLRIDGRQTRPLSWIVPSPERADWDHIIDEMAVECAGSRFLKAVVDNAQFGEGVHASLRPHERKVVIMRHGLRLATIYATHAHVPQREAIHANFLMPGPHWQQVADVLQGAEAELAAKWKREQEDKAAAEAATATAEEELRRAAARQRFDHFPSDVPQEIIDACLDASRRIRLERQVAYERPVVLQWDFDEMTLLPIAGIETRLLMPFRLNRRGETLHGELVLGNSDPLPLLICEGVGYKTAITAWIYALLGFADATCTEPEQVKPTAWRESARPQWRLPTSVHQRRPSTRTIPQKRWSGYLEPIGPWTHYSGSFVAGHRRRLSDGRTASAEACDRARQVGITLQAHETWVRPHTRSIAEDIEICFRWHAPGVLDSSGK